MGEFFDSQFVSYEQSIFYGNVSDICFSNLKFEKISHL